MIHIRAKATGEVLHTVASQTLPDLLPSPPESREFELQCLDLRGANLSHADLRGADLSGANLVDADLSRARLENADLSGADLTGASLDSSWLIDASLQSANLTNAVVTNALLWRADLDGAKLRGADLHGSAFNKYTKWPRGVQAIDLGAVETPYWATDQSIEDHRPEGLHTACEFTPLVDHPWRETLTRVRRSIHRRARTARVFMQFCELPDDKTTKIGGERVWTEYSVGVDDTPWWQAKFLDSELVIMKKGNTSDVIPYAEIKSIHFPNMKNAFLPGGILMPKQAEHKGVTFLYDTAIIETHSASHVEVKAAVGKNGLRDISFWYEIVRGALLDQDRAAREISGETTRRSRKAAPFAVVCIRNTEESEITKVYIVSMCEQTVARLKLTRDLPQGNVIIAAPSGSTGALIKGRLLVLDEPVKLQSGEALTIDCLQPA